MIVAQKIKIRIYFNQDLAQVSEVLPDEAQTHYLNNVLRVEDGEVIAGFDGKNGEYALLVKKKREKEAKSTEARKIT